MKQRGQGLVITLAVLGGIALIAALVVGGYAIKYWTAGPRGAVGVNEKIQADANRRLGTYEQFFNEYGAIKSIVGSIPPAHQAIDQFKADHAGDLNSYANSTGLQHLETVLLGLRQGLASAVNEYNAQSSNASRNIFKDNSLPLQICIGATGETTSPC